MNILQTVVVPEVGGPSGPVDGIMTKNITIPADSTLEVSISMQLKYNIMVHNQFLLSFLLICSQVIFNIALVGWKNESDFEAITTNPLLEVLFDDVSVFDIDKAGFLCNNQLKLPKKFLLKFVQH